MFYLIGRYINIEYKIIWSVSQIKSYSVLPWGYHLFQLQEIFICLTNPQEYSMVITWDSDHLEYDEDRFGEVTSEVFSRFCSLYIYDGFYTEVLLYSFMLMYVLEIVFWTIPGIYVVNLDRIFLHDWVEWYSGRHCICLRQK